VFCGLSYDLGRALEATGSPPPADLGTPVLFAAAHRWLLRYSYPHRRYELCSPAADEGELRSVARRLERLARLPPPPSVAAGTAGLRSNLTREEYLAAVRRILAYIAAGDVYQVNLAQRFEVSGADEPPADLFARMLARHPAAFSAYVDGGDWALVSASPECFLRRDGARVATFPIKGTIARGASAADDKAMARALRSSVKDRAEHLMIVDLERNDLGRVCRFGSVRGPRLASLYTLPSLHHLESEVSGVLRPGTSTAALLRATFPGGSITGAPKIRAMQIIDEVEPVSRGFYTGAIGFADAEGHARFNIAIRTAVTTSRGLAYHAGGGIVADSDPEAEYEETWLKTRAFFEALYAESR
jgi:para-aminobenzoate synthetase component 1